uniref:Cytochrome c biogenesis protein CcsA n=1 Tax=Characiochloris acuminata TaxID=167768 RepID=A0A0S2LPN9_9CHLO|nr:heme attachment to plastid cytochrome c [Characiochloris acuminata]ALO63267.1 heme attachment to plastid cytochrome c [Characiochloris acuminata]
MNVYLQNFFANFSFLILLCSLICYWIDTSSFLFKTNKSSNASSVAINSSNLIRKLGYIGILISNICLVFLLLIRWKESGHFPLSNLYESLMFLSWCFTLIHLILDRSSIRIEEERSELADARPVPELAYARPLGAITTPSALFTNAFATFSLPPEMQATSPLVPALQSNWLMMHVTVMILSYAALISGSLLAIVFLILTFGKENEVLGQLADARPVNNSTYSLRSRSRKELAMTIDNLSYRILGIGFPFLTIGILSGAVWANEAWGSYWSWDPKETWALLTWLVFAIYLHTRLNKGWQGRSSAIIAATGFIVVWICYLGVNLLGEGLHSYGWLN